MILSKFSCTALIRAAACCSILLGLLYVPSSYTLPIVGLGAELEGGQQLAKQWGMYAIVGGAIIFLASFLLNLSRTIPMKRIVLAACLIAAALLVVAQFLPLFWWMFVGSAVFSWTTALGFSLHLALLLLSLWGAVVSINAIEQLKPSELN